VCISDMFIRLVMVLVFFSNAACAAVDAEGYDERTIRASDIPADAPRFEQYPAASYTGRNAAPDLRTEPRSRRYRTVLNEWSKEAPNFAGHYILATWGCGTGCAQIAIIDARTGKIFHPAGLQVNSIANVDDQLLTGGGTSRLSNDFGALQYRVESRLLVVIGAPNDDLNNRGISYFVWENDRLRRLRFVPKR
jgi:hypothetical protein